VAERILRDTLGRERSARRLAGVRRQVASGTPITSPVPHFSVPRFRRQENGGQEYIPPSSMPDTPSPKQLARRAEHELKAAANVRTARQAKFYFKPGEEVWYFGVDTPTQRRMRDAIERFPPGKRKTLLEKTKER